MFPFVHGLAVRQPNFILLGLLHNSAGRTISAPTNSSSEAVETLLPAYSPSSTKKSLLPISKRHEGIPRPSARCLPRVHFMPCWHICSGGTVQSCQKYTDMRDLAAGQWQLLSATSFWWQSASVDKALSSCYLTNFNGGCMILSREDVTFTCILHYSQLITSFNKEEKVKRYTGF